MLESLLTIGLLFCMAGVALAVGVGPQAWLVTGFWLVVVGLGFGIPTGLLYHVALRRSLLAADRLPSRWWLRPTALHDRLPASDRAWVLGWCTAGAAGFAVSLLGCLLVAVGAWRLLALQ